MGWFNPQTGEVASKMFRVDLDLQPDRVPQLISDRSGVQKVVPNLVAAASVLAPSLYKRFSDSKGKSNFREQMLRSLRIGWVEPYGTARTDKIIDRFTSLAASLDYNGALIFGLGPFWKPRALRSSLHTIAIFWLSREVKLDSFLRQPCKSP